MIDWNRLLLDRLYAPQAFGVPATLTPMGTGSPVALTIVDQTKGLEFTYQNVDVPTIRPAADVREREVASLGMTEEDLLGSSLSFKGRDWRIESIHHRPKPGTEGEFRLRLIDVGATTS